MTHTDRICTLLNQSHTIAVVGLSPKPSRPSHRVAAALQSFGFRILPVRPAVSRILGEPAWPSLHDLPEKPDLVNVFRAPEHVAEIVADCIELNIAAIWLQDGVIDEEAAKRARSAGITVIMDRCIHRDYVQLGCAHHNRSDSSPRNHVQLQAHS
ncbi:MAG: CoA-binding protein [Pseudomonadota bacterium]